MGMGRTLVDGELLLLLLSNLDELGGLLEGGGEGLLADDWINVSGIPRGGESLSFRDSPCLPASRDSLAKS